MEGMTLGEMRVYLNKLHEISPQNDGFMLAIPTNDPSIPARSRVYVTGVSMGFDWERGCIMMTPSEPIKKADGSE